MLSDLIKKMTLGAGGWSFCAEEIQLENATTKWELFSLAIESFY